MKVYDCYIGYNMILMYLDVDNPRSLAFTRLRFGVTIVARSGCWPASLPDCCTSDAPMLALAAAETFDSVQKGRLSKRHVHKGLHN